LIKLHKIRFIPLLLTLLLIVMMAVPAMPDKSLAAQPTVGLGTTESFAILAGATVTNTGTTTINGSAGGDVGVSPGAAVTGFPPGILSVGTIHAADAVAAQAQIDLTTAYNDAVGRTGAVNLSGQDLGGLTLTPGVYSFSSSAQLTGTLTLDGLNQLDPVFVFQVGSTLTTASGSNVNLLNGARYCRTFWQVSSSATLGTNSDFVGHIFALTSITATNGARVQGQLLARNGAVTLNSNTITNGFCATPAAPPVPPASATLHVIKHVINDNGRTAAAANFNLHVKAAGVDVATSPAPGAETPGTTYTLAAGTYAVSEDAFPGYTVSYSGDSDTSGNITLAAGADKTVTITNNDIAAVVPPGAATLHVIKHVINDNAGTAVAANFNLHVKNAGIDVVVSPAPGAEAPGTIYTLAAGTYAVSEDAFPGYTTVYSGDSDAGGNITLAAGANKTVTITNNDIPAFVPAVPATLHVIKHVINDNGRTAVAANFNLHVKKAGIEVAASPAPGLEAPGKTYTLAAGTYTVSEDAIAGYTQIYSGDSDVNGNVTLVAGANKTVTITNNDTIIPTGGGGGSTQIYPPLINIIKTPEPLALTSGAGLVTYTYKVNNPGNVSLSNVTVTDDKVSPVNYVSGDINADSLLQTNETWIYSSQMTLNTTTTNTATAKGSANGMTATDIAIATVVLSAVVPVYPPLINVIKKPEPLALIAGAGLVTYTYKVTNPGMVSLSNVSLTDDKVNPVNYVSGDVNMDNLLQPDEIWIYTSQMMLNTTTTNTATAKGNANGMTATDIAIATVVVTPSVVVAPTVTGGQIPKTSTPLYQLIIFGVLLALVGYLGWRKRNHYE